MVEGTGLQKLRGAHFCPSSELGMTRSPVLRWAPVTQTLYIAFGRTNRFVSTIPQSFIKKPPMGAVF